MFIVAKIILCIVSLFAALCLACAVCIGRRAPLRERHFGVAPRTVKRASSAPADPFSEAFGDVASTGFTTEQLRQVAPSVVTTDPLRRSFIKPSAGFALRSADAGSDGEFPSDPAAARTFFGKAQR